MATSMAFRGFRPYQRSQRNATLLLYPVTFHFSLAYLVFTEASTHFSSQYTLFSLADLMRVQKKTIKDNKGQFRFCLKERISLLFM